MVGVVAGGNVVVVVTSSCSSTTGAGRRLGVRRLDCRLARTAALCATKMKDRVNTCAIQSGNEVPMMGLELEELVETESETDCECATLGTSL
jgi:hypothetical protein